jgi:hypothetical protein
LEYNDIIKQDCLTCLSQGKTGAARIVDILGI